MAANAEGRLVLHGILHLCVHRIALVSCGCELRVTLYRRVVYGDG